LESYEDRIVIDVRPVEEYQKIHLVDALNFPSKELLTAFCDTLDRELPLFIYCKSGERSRSAMLLLKKMGFVNVWELEGGIFPIYNVIDFKGYRQYFVIY